MSESFDAALVVTQRDALVVELAALKKHQGDTARSLARSATATAKAQGERDAALATIGRVRALAETWRFPSAWGQPDEQQAWVLDGAASDIRIALAPTTAQDAREGTSNATKGETGSELHPRSSSPDTVESKVGTK